MKVILREDIPSVGRSGEIIEVREGFGRNYLIPRKLAVMASEKNVKQLEHEKKVIAARQAKLKAAAGEVAGQVGRASVKIARRVGEQDKLFGSVTALDIADELQKQGVRVDRRHIHLPEPIKTVGTHEVDIKLHAEVTAKVKVEVVPEA
ncbi:MAG: 50S ribosomal protein L9 [Myxococcales bacterium]